jgi:ABC-type transporter Mla MlaB component
MSKDEKSGLFSKVVRLVSQPRGAADESSDSRLSEPDSSTQDKLREMAERKKRNDFVRRREFAMLRRVRRKQLRDSPDAHVRPSFFQSSLTSRPDERVRTLEKIDEIEAQMSMQWWKGTDNAGATTRAGSHGDPTQRLGRPSALYATPERTDPVMFDSAPTVPATLATPVASPISTLFGAPTERLPEPEARFELPIVPAAVPPVPKASHSPRPSAAAAPPLDEPSGGFSLSKSFAIEVDEMAHDPGLEEAAIRFANGDDKGAEAALKTLLADRGDVPTSAESWLALFDFYRATRQQAPFESLALDFVGRFGSSPPQWGALHVEASPAQPASTPSVVSSRKVHWICPAVLTETKVQALRTLLSKATPPLRIDWSPLTVIEEPALQVLTAQLRDWASGAQPLQFKALDRIDRVLTNATPSGDRDVTPQWWLLRLEWLRLLGRLDDFELAALDYCVTYEVSPPAWEAPLTVARALEDGGDAGSSPASTAPVREDPSPLSDFGSTGFQTSFQATQIGVDTTRVVTVSLSGQVLGDADAYMATLDRGVTDADLIEVNCERLVRMDFPAAGALLNWITVQNGQGHQIRLLRPHRLVAAFFHVIGMGESARIVTRTD